MLPSHLEVFSPIIAGSGISNGLAPELGTLSAAYVLFTATLGPLMLRAAEPLLQRWTKVAPAAQSCNIQDHKRRLKRTEHPTSVS